MSLDTLPRLCFERVCDFLPPSSIYRLRDVNSVCQRYTDWHISRLEAAATTLWRIWQRRLQRYDRYYDSLVNRLNDTQLQELNNCENINDRREIIRKALTNPSAPLCSFYSTGLQEKVLVSLNGELPLFQAPIKKEHDLIVNIRLQWSGKRGIVALCCDTGRGLNMICADISKNPFAVVPQTHRTALVLISGESPVKVSYTKIYLLDNQNRISCPLLGHLYPVEWCCGLNGVGWCKFGLLIAAAKSDDDAGSSLVRSKFRIFQG